MMRKYVYRTIGDRISIFSKYYDYVYQIDPLLSDQKLLIKNIKNSCREILSYRDFTSLKENKNKRGLLLFNGNLNYSLNIQEYLKGLYDNCSRFTRIAAVLYNPYLFWIYKLFSFLKIRKAPTPTTFITRVDLENLVKLSNFEIVSQYDMIYFPFKLFGIGTLINKFFALIPVVKRFSLVSLVILKPKIKSVSPSLSIVIPARNERGNIKEALDRIPDLKCDIEIVFVEGNSQDDTWEEIQKVAQDSKYLQRFKIKYYKQPNKGKNDAVKLGFKKASNELLVILDADLTMPPELLPQFYHAYCEGHADFINGCRLVYPMEKMAMRFLNRLGNKFFAKILSILLSTKIGDSLCGTKMMAKEDYDRIVRWREDFGDFDPFGDFDFLFAASELELSIVDVPIRYKARTYGSTQISRFVDGATLLKMTLIALFKIKFKKI